MSENAWGCHPVHTNAPPLLIAFVFYGSSRQITLQVNCIGKYLPILGPII